MPSNGTMPSTRFKNRLGNSKSPYLLLHKDNPVAWQQWSAEAVAMAKRLDKPIFLSSGYSACHWCHVLASESFEDPETAKIMNENYVNIMIDREERPDVDRIYMGFLQETQGGGGWPLSVFLTPDLVPFFAGTYYPRDRFRSLMDRVHKSWIHDREGCEDTGRRTMAKLRDSAAQLMSTANIQDIIDTNPCHKVWNHFVSTNDSRYGGFAQQGNHSTGPKFPSSSMTLEALTRFSIQSPVPGLEDVRPEAREMGIKMLRAMWYGGIRDWVGHGFARYTVDEKWLVPHFEKMLADQAQLMMVATAFAAISSYETARGTPVETLENDKKLCTDFAIDILQYILEGLQSPEGAFWSSEDSNATPHLGEIKAEGAFYTWTKEEFDAVVGPEDAELVGSYFGVKAEGNVPTKNDQHGALTRLNVLHRAHSIQELGVVFGFTRAEESIIADKIYTALEKLRRHRDKTRERPALDDKIITSWNAMLVSALARVAVYLSESDHPVVDECIPTAERIIAFIKCNMWNPATRTLTRVWKDGKGAIAQADDYSSMIKCLLDLFEATGREEHALFAYELQVRQNELFWDPVYKGYFVSADDPTIIVRLKDGLDGAEPSASSVAVHNLPRIASLFEDEYEQWYGIAVETYTSVSKELTRFPMAIGYTVAGLMDLQRGYKSFYLSGPSDDETIIDMRKAIDKTFLPNKITIQVDHASPPRRLAEKNGTIRRMIEEGYTGPELQVYQGKQFQESLRTAGDVQRYLQEQVNIEPRRRSSS